MDSNDDDRELMYFEPFLTSRYTKPIHFESNSEEFIIISTEKSIFKYWLKAGTKYEEIAFPKTFKPVNHVAIIDRSSDKLYLCGGKDKGFAVMDIRTNKFEIKVGDNYGAPMNATWLASFCISNHANSSMNGLHLSSFDSHFKFDLNDEVWHPWTFPKSSESSPLPVIIPYFVESKGVILKHEFKSKFKFEICNVFDELMIFVDIGVRYFSLHTFEFCPIQSGFTVWIPTVSLRDVFVSNDLRIYFANLGVHWQVKAKICDVLPKKFYKEQKLHCQKVVNGFVRLMAKCLKRYVSKDIVEIIFNFFTIFA